MTDSTISNLNIQNTPVQCFSINGAENLYVTNVTIDNSAGDETDSDGKLEEKEGNPWISF